MKIKYTPGPWGYSESCGDYDIYSHNILSKISIATVHEETDGNEEANARLIAAAPDMLKALKDTVEWFKENQPQTEPNVVLAAIEKTEWKP